MNLRHAAALALVTCMLSMPATTPFGAAYSAFGISKAAFEAQALKSPIGWYGEKAHCACSDEPRSPKEIPTPREKTTPVPDNE